MYIIKSVDRTKLSCYSSPSLLHPSPPPPLPISADPQFFKKLTPFILKSYCSPLINFVQIIGSVVRVHVNNHKVHDTARKCEYTCNFHVSLHCACSFQIYWADSGELCCIATDESFFILKYVAENVAKAQENPESITEDGIEDAFDVRLTLSC